MFESNYDEIYGMDLGEYCASQGTTIGALIKKVETDIAILKARFKKLYKPIEACPLADQVYKVLGKKEKHLERLKEWKIEYNPIPTREDVYADLVKIFKRENKDVVDFKSETVPDLLSRKANQFAIKHTDIVYLEGVESRRKKLKPKDKS